MYITVFALFKVSLSIVVENIVIINSFIFSCEDNEKNESEMENTKLQNKRKREKENEVGMSGEEDESIAKKSRCQSSASSGRLELNLCPHG